MPKSLSHYLIGYYSRLIRDEQRWIEKDSLSVEMLVDSLIRDLEDIKRWSQRTDVDWIVHHGYIRLFVKIQRICETSYTINNSRQNIRYYKDEILKFKGILKWTD